MVKLITRKQYDTAYPLVLQFSDVNGPVDLTPAQSVMFTMVNRNTRSVLKVHAAMTPLDQGSNKGQARYQWAAPDVDTAGVFLCEARVTFVDGTIAKWPGDDYAQLDILAALAP